ncbi:uncharacterized protein LOC121429311 isoform X2 [Lytechinus variegatus]|nr:uncharacterized protein LOC121429311 isoform X2 [Lytechinus variegatus]XP_041482254.1 uncharacterized protein LOC121429311 isoform X2 [Lytechinus variegatus]XP_041482255.1 uncharacterized protein LOC121429311 isoform X2 [Lytechinus variegatus]
MAARRDKHKTPVFIEKASREQTRIQEKLNRKLRKDIQRLLQEGTYSDITLPCGPTPMLIHRAFIKSRVPGLLDILCPDGVPNKTILDAIAAEDLRLFVKSVYQEDDLEQAWKTFLSCIAIPEVEEEHTESLDASCVGDVAVDPRNGEESEGMGAPGEAANFKASTGKEFSEAEEPCRRHTNVDSVGTCIAGGAGIQDGLSMSQVVPIQHEGTPEESCIGLEPCQNQGERSGNDSLASKPLPHTGETDSSKINCANGIEQVGLAVADHQGAEAASAVTQRYHKGNVKQMDVCQYVTIDSTMGILPNPLLLKEKCAPGPTLAGDPVNGTGNNEDIPSNSSDRAMGSDPHSDSNAVIVNGVVDLDLNGHDEPETHGTDQKQLSIQPSKLRDPTSDSQSENYDDQEDSKRKPKSPVVDVHAIDSDELQQFVSRILDLPVPSGTLSENLMQLLDSDASTFSDVVLVSSNGTRIPAHRCLLHCRCEFFAAMLGGGWIESETHEIQLKGVSRPVVDAMLRFMYGGIASLSDEVNLRDLLSAADMYGLEELKDLTAFHLKRDWCHLFHKPLCAECLSLIPHCYALCESYGLPDLSLTCLRWMSKNLDRFWIQKTFSALPTEMLEKCSKDVVDSLNFKSVIEVLFQLDKLRLGLPQGQSSWAEPVKDITSKTRKQVLQFAANKFYVILRDGSTFENKYLKGMGWKKDVMEPLFRTVVSGLSLENADLNFQAVWRLYKRERTEEKEQGKTPEEEWNQDAYVAVGGLYEKLYNYVVSNASYIIHTEGFKQLPDDLQKQIRKDAVYVDEGLSKTTKKPVLSSSQRPKSAQVRRTLSHPLRAPSPASSTSSASSTGSAPSSSRSRGGGTRSTRGAVTGSSRGARNPPRESGGSVRGAGGPQRGAGHSSRGNRVPPRGTGSRSARVTVRAGGPARGNGTSGSRGGAVGVSGRDGTQQQMGPSDGGQPQGS